jgi:hypothetical protein
MALCKAYLPSWIAWFGAAFTVPMWLYVTWLAFAGSQELSMAGWLVTSVVLAAVLVLLVLLGTRRLPAYLIDIPEEVLRGGR